MKNFWKWTKRIVLGLLVLILILVGLLLVAGARAKAKLAAANPPPGELVDVGGYRMHIYCTGVGSPTVILEAGLNDFYVSWAQTQPAIAQATRVCSFDRAGLGWSELSPRPRTSEVMAEELHTLLAKANIAGPYILVGHSFGGINLRVFARMYPAEAAGMVLVDSAHEEQSGRLPFLKDATEQAIGQLRLFSFLSASGLMALLPENIPNRGLSAEVYKQYQAVVATTRYFQGAMAESAGVNGSAASPKIAGLGDLPLIVLTHEKFEAMPGLTASQQEQFEQEWTKMQRELAGLSSKSKQIIASASGHYIQVDRPELVIEAILELVYSLSTH